jgi:hypothetical protein
VANDRLIFGGQNLTLVTVTPWVENLGYQNAFIVAAFAGLAQVLTFLIFLKYGKRFRAASTSRYLKYVRQITDAGLTH